VTGADSARLVRLVTDGGLAEIVLDRPEKLNAMSMAMVEQLMAALAAAERSPIRCLLVRGEGRAFCAGRDLSEADPGIEDGEAILRDVFHPLMRRMAAVAVPTFAAVQGACLGTGLGLALACDVVHVADDARIGSPFARIGAVPDSGAHAALVHRVGRHRALELIYTGRMLSGREAAALGLVNGSVPAAELLEQTRKAARAAASGPTAAFRESKRIVERLSGGAPTLDQVLDLEAEAQGRASRTADYREGIAAFQEKREPRFQGR
jgi:enoyl-CoA hydratase/carnithine racemase